ncbi:MAG: class I peptide chain release factor [Nitrospirae bacterium]|nr:MAG: class I peptide chain release factor [Nitrospirota bacterium]
MQTFAVSEEKNRWLRHEMEALGIGEADIEEKFVRSSGKGGQKVNKTSSCVYLLHKPTGLEVKCMKDRSQSINRFLARRELLEKIKKLRGLPTADDLEREKIRKQKQKKRRRQRSETLEHFSSGRTGSKTEE